jgi:TPR repeat protein
MQALTTRSPPDSRYTLSANQGVAQAQYNLAVCYHHGTGVDRNEREAMRLYRLAADQGHTAAEQELSDAEGCRVM